MSVRTTRLAAMLAVVLLGLALVASGCGSSSSEDGVAALAGSSAETEAAPAAEDDDVDVKDREEAALEWARCMREHGIDVPDPDFGNGGVGIRVRGQGSNPNSEKFRRAQEACGTPFGREGPPALSEEERQELQDAMLAFARCMREHGVDMPDPEFGEEGRGVFRVGPGPGATAPEQESFEEAQEACQPILQELRERREADREEP